ncbi:NADH:ubiquinone oxidoreductase 6.6kD subunit [Fusarium austroafricanum]|uniref:NADH:ubiquinone oxidoreductase 6.6kD subunit n=1 Tax=Fusarium austroafricanum TaxID=2364996 RepID=A0A8H4KIJ1_9HYPO|nr:NADH:ubiquinone oxidoreductase 6.6kD subunit [Fusarium austroafricanum]
MAHLNVKPDPAYLKYASMMKTRHHYFRWTNRTAKITFIYVAVIPSIMGYIAYKTDKGLWDFRAKRKGDLVYEK